MKKRNIYIILYYFSTKKERRIAGLDAWLRVHEATSTCNFYLVQGGSRNNIRRLKWEKKIFARLVVAQTARVVGCRNRGHLREL